VNGVLSCETFRELAPELALGTAVGDERAAALDHVRSCAMCRQVLAELTGTVDALLLSAPAVEPPAGFELRALAAFDEVGAAEPGGGVPSAGAGAGAPEHASAPVGPAGPDDEGVAVGPGAPVVAVGAASRRRPVRWLVAAAVVLLVAGAAIVLAQRSPDPSTVSASGILRTAQGDAVGQVAVEEGSELVVSADGGAPAGTYRVQCDYQSGRPYTAGNLVIGPDGLDRWSATVDVPTYDLRRVRLVSTDGTANLEAEMTG